VTTAPPLPDDVRRYRDARARIEQLPLPDSLPALLDQAVLQWPDRPAVNFFELERGRLSFRELRDASLAVAELLSDLGVEPGDHVMVALPNIPMFPVTWLALARLKAVMVPANDRYTASEFAFVISDSEPVVIVTAHELAPTIADALGATAVKAHVVTTASDATLALDIAGISHEVSAPAQSERAFPESQADDRVGIHYTSGTTGFPKGCILTHRTWLIAAAVSLHMLPFPPHRILSDAPYFYIDAPAETALALMSGAEQYIAGRASLSKFVRRLSDLDIDYVEVWEALADEVLDPEAEASLRSRGTVLHASSFGLRDSRRADVEERLHAVVREMFGMTEIGFGTLVPYDVDVAPHGTCGLAAPYRETRIVDPETGEDLDDGAVGELWVRGPGVMLGYHRRPEVNKELLKPDGWFRTGDLMRRDALGFHFMVGRIKDMIRRSHENISAREVEEALQSIPGVLSAAVVGVPNPMRGEEVKAFIVLDPAHREELSPEVIVEKAADSLARFKLPRYIEFVAELPLTPSGKVAKAELRRRDEGATPRGWDQSVQEWRP
jgi:crotonobetaine/carnitine-CoA ligase